MHAQVAVAFGVTQPCKEGASITDSTTPCNWFAVLHLLEHKQMQLDTRHHTLDFKGGPVA